ncbi:MAG: 5'/3'-nucleotidase SurE [bacterium]
MNILLSNDDGCRARGLGVLAEALSARFAVTVVAPEQNCSGASNSLSLHRTLCVTEHPARAPSPNRNGFYSVDGTPADCVHLAITGMLDFQPDMVVAGINHGANLGDDVIYSGTVAAAIEGRFLGLPAIAVSLASDYDGVDDDDDGDGDNNNDDNNDGDARHFATAAEVVVRMLLHLRDRPLPRDTILNINVPDLATADLRGFQATRLGARHQSQPIIEQPRADAECARRYYRIGTIGDGADNGLGTDFDAVRARSVSVTPLQIDMTRHRALAPLRAWLAEAGAAR